MQHNKSKKYLYIVVWIFWKDLWNTQNRVGIHLDCFIDVYPEHSIVRRLDT